jgi:hypothetical protein
VGEEDARGKRMWREKAQGRKGQGKKEGGKKEEGKKEGKEGPTSNAYPHTKHSLGDDIPSIHSRKTNLAVTD